MGSPYPAPEQCQVQSLLLNVGKEETVWTVFPPYPQILTQKCEDSVILHVQSFWICTERGVWCSSGANDA